MTQVRAFSYLSSDQRQAIHAQEWLPRGRPRAVVQIVHGLSEYVGRYDWAARRLNDRGFLVCGSDHLGHGRTVQDGKYGYFAPKGGWELVTRDMERLRELQGEKYPGLPYFLLGHSMGSFLVRSYLIRRPGTVDGAVLSGTGQESALLVALGKWLAGTLAAVRGPRYVSPLVTALSLGAYNKKFQPNRTLADWISRDERAVDAYLQDPLCVFLPTVSMFRDMMGGLQFIGNRKNLARMDRDTPVYFFSGDRDPVGAMGEGVKKVAGMFREAGCRDVEVRLYPGGRHEMLSELNREEVAADLTAWLEKRLKT